MTVTPGATTWLDCWTFGSLVYLTSVLDRISSLHHHNPFIRIFAKLPTSISKLNHHCGYVQGWPEDEKSLSEATGRSDSSSTSQAVPFQPPILAPGAAGSAKPEPRTDPTALRFPPQDPARQRGSPGSAARRRAPPHRTAPRPGPVPRRYLPATAAVQAAAPRL